MVECATLMSILKIPATNKFFCIYMEVDVTPLNAEYMLTKYKETNITILPCQIVDP
jgi:hypothetical protein